MEQSDLYHEKVRTIIEESYDTSYLLKRNKAVDLKPLLSEIDDEKKQANILKNLIDIFSNYFISVDKLNERYIRKFYSLTESEDEEIRSLSEKLLLTISKIPNLSDVIYESGLLSDFNDFIDREYNVIFLANMAAATSEYRDKIVEFQLLELIYNEIYKKKCFINTSYRAVFYFMGKLFLRNFPLDEGRAHVYRLCFHYLELILDTYGELSSDERGYLIKALSIVGNSKERLARLIQFKNGELFNDIFRYFDIDSSVYVNNFFKFMIIVLNKENNIDDFIINYIPLIVKYLCQSIPKHGDFFDDFGVLFKRIDEISPDVFRDPEVIKSFLISIINTSFKVKECVVVFLSVCIAKNINYLISLDFMLTFEAIYSPCIPASNTFFPIIINCLSVLRHKNVELNRIDLEDYIYSSDTFHSYILEQIELLTKNDYKYANGETCLSLLSKCEEFKVRLFSV